MGNEELKDTFVQLVLRLLIALTVIHDLCMVKVTPRSCPGLWPLAQEPFLTILPLNSMRTATA